MKTLLLYAGGYCIGGVLVGVWFAFCIWAYVGAAHR